MRKQIASWLLIALLLASTTAHAMNVTQIPSESLTVPLETCEAEIDGLVIDCKDELTRQSAACEQTLRDMAATMTTACDAAVESAVAAERRESEPRISGLEAANLRLQSSANTWRIVALVGIPVAMVIGAVVGVIVVASL